MAGGIQPGTTASSAESTRLDKQVRRISKIVLKKLQPKYPELERLHKLPKHMLYEGIGACSPDGGAWTYKGKLLSAFEGKYQKIGGNAIERWFKNFHHISEVNPRCPLVTFAAGPGARQGEVIYKTLYRPTRGQYNKIRHAGPSVFLSEPGYDDHFIEETMIRFIEGEIRRLQ